jgi:hypothetical protein
VQERTATCMVDGKPASQNDLRCRSQQQPVLQQPCLGSCHTAANFSFWLASEDWSSCKGGQTERVATCHTNDGKDQPDEVTDLGL